MSQKKPVVKKEHKGRPVIYAPSFKEWRNWLQKNGTKESSVWIQIFKKESGIKSIYYDEAVDHALCFGWIDSVANKNDELSYFQYFSVRKPTSKWSKVNKLKVERLEKEGLIMPEGQKSISIAKSNGTWNALDQVEELTVPTDLKAAFAKNKRAFNNWDAFPKSAKRAILEWISNAKKTETREKRIKETVSKAAENIRANYPG